MPRDILRIANHEILSEEVTVHYLDSGTSEVLAVQHTEDMLGLKVAFVTPTPSAAKSPSKSPSKTASS